MIFKSPIVGFLLTLTDGKKRFIAPSNRNSISAHVKRNQYIALMKNPNPTLGWQIESIGDIVEYVEAEGVELVTVGANDGPTAVLKSQGHTAAVPHKQGSARPSQPQRVAEPAAADVSKIPERLIIEATTPAEVPAETDTPEKPKRAYKKRNQDESLTQPNNAE